MLISFAVVLVVEKETGRKKEITPEVGSKIGFEKHFNLLHGAFKL
jgi:hypothetical protein